MLAHFNRYIPPVVEQVSCFKFCHNVCDLSSRVYFLCTLYGQSVNGKLFRYKTVQCCKNFSLQLNLFDNE